MSSPTHSDSGDLATLQGLPDDVWCIILSLCVHDIGLFSSDIEYTVVAARHNPMPLAISNFTLAFIPLSRRFYGMAIGILWRYVVVCSPTSLAQVAQFASTYGQYTWRVELCVTELYHLPTILDVLCHMPNLWIFLHHNYSSCITPVQGTNPEHVVQALCRFCPLLCHVQFDAEWEYPSLDHILDLLNAKPSLEALRISGLASDDATVLENWEGRTPLCTCSSLQSLSLGASYWIMQTDHQERALASFLSMLTASDALPNLTTVHLMENCLSSVSFLEKYGPQLDSLLSLPPNDWSLHSWDFDIPQFMNLCPQLRHACWFFKDWNGINAAQPITGSHPTLCDAEIVLHKIEITEPNGYQASMQTILNCILRGDFPALKTVLFVAKGGVTPDYVHSEWFAQFVEAFRNKNTDGVRSTDDVGVRLYAV